MVSRELCDACGAAISVISPAVMSRDAFNKIRKSEQGGAIHACEWETSIILHVSPELVDMSQATDKDIMRYHSDFVAGDSFKGSQRVTWSTWYLQSSESGIYGDPTCASAETGKIVMDTAVSEGARFLKEYWHMSAPEICRAANRGVGSHHAVRRTTSASLLSERFHEDG
jgi:creatinine amidohydrolase